MHVGRRFIMFEGTCAYRGVVTSVITITEDALAFRCSKVEACEFPGSTWEKHTGKAEVWGVRAQSLEFSLGFLLGVGRIFDTDLRSHAEDERWLELHGWQKQKAKPREWLDAVFRKALGAHV